MAQQDLFLNKEIGNYKLVELLGKGTYGRVYKAEHLYVPRTIAIKLLRSELSSRETIAQFWKEARDLARLKNDHIVEVLDFGFYDQTTPYLMMPLARRNLGDQFPKGIPVDLGTILPYIKVISQALQYAHYTVKLVHRDIKPANLLLDENGKVLVSDFGLAVVAHSINSLSPQEPLGSPYYMAPEQWQGLATPASDQYALAICIYQWLCGDVPFRGNIENVYSAHRKQKPPSFRSNGINVPTNVEKVVMKALEKNQKKRFHDVQAFANALDQAYKASLMTDSKQPVPPETIKRMSDQQSTTPVGIRPFKVPVLKPAMPFVVPNAPGNGGIEEQKIAFPLPPGTPLSGKPKRKNRRRWLLIVASIALFALLVRGVIFTFTSGLDNRFGVAVGTTVTITPDHPTVSDNFAVTAVTGTPNPAAQQIQARILSYTSPSQSSSVNAVRSIPGRQASGILRFVNIGDFNVSLPGGILSGGDGVQVSFGTVVVPVGSIDVTGTAVTPGMRGNIGAFDINGTCCGNSNIIVKDPFGFSGGRDPIPLSNPVITQNDINTASSNLISTLKPSAQSALQQQVQANEQAVNGSLMCTSNMTANHQVGDQAISVTVTGTVACTEEVYDQKGALNIAINALRTKVAKNRAYAGYVLVGNVVTSITSAAEIDTGNTISLMIAAQGTWVYQFTNTILKGIKTKIARELESVALTDVRNTRGVEKGDKSVMISISSGEMMPDAADITINVVKVPGLAGLPTTTPSGTTPTSTPAITPSPGLGNGVTITRNLT